MLAIIKTGGKQYKISEGDIIKIEKITGSVDDIITFDEVLFVGDDKKVSVGDPIVKNAVVEAKIIEHARHDKVWGIKQKAKKRYRLKYGHRQEYTKVEITKIS